ncbi:MAG: SDR family oxidoreductase [Gammaproteobacteria bacterium]|nr:SDR family oxidoreductase [Gammaproteobacteria bacterium]
MNKFENIKNHLLNHQYTWLITGVAGFIGSNLLESLLKLNQRVVGLDNFATGYKKNIAYALEQLPEKQQHNFQFHEGDIRNLQDCQTVIKGVDYVLHQAALGSIPRSINNPLATNDTNVNGFLNMLLTSKNNNVKRFVYASSSSVYGDSQNLPKVEDIIGKQLSPYASSKYANEIYATAFANSYPITTIGLRYFNVFGARQDFKGAYAAVIPTWVSSFLDEKDIYINGDGETSRDFCYIKNVIQANILAATATDKTALNTVYNIAAGDRTTLNDLFLMIRNGLNKPNDKKPIYRDFRPGDIRHSLADISKASKLLGYQPTHSVSTGLTEALSWYKKHHGENQ